MKDINIFINEKLKISETSFMLEKLKIGTDTKIGNHVLLGICKVFNCEQKEAEFLVKYYIYDKKKQEEFYDFNEFKNTVVSPLEAFLMLALMLVDEGNNINDIETLGYKNYKKHKYNPYDYSWFDEEDVEGIDLLEVCKSWISYQNNKDEFKKIFNFVKKHYKDIKKFAKDEKNENVITFFFNYFYDYLS